jgi:hypothetical protein
MSRKPSETLDVSKLIDDGSGANRDLRDRYEFVDDDSVSQTTGHGVNLPPVRVPSSKAAEHGGSYGYEPSKGSSMTVDCGGQKFTIPSLVDLPAEVKQAINAELAMANNDSDLDGSDFGKTIAKVFKKYLAIQHEDGLLPPLKTWVNGNKDPFKRTVNLPPPICMSDPRFKKSAAVTPPATGAQKMQQGYFSPAVAAGRPAAAGMSPDQRAAFANFNPPGSPNTVSLPPQAAPRREAQPPAPARQVVAPQVPNPEIVVAFQSAMGSIRSRYHHVQLVSGTPIYNPDTNETLETFYLVLSKNSLNPGAGDDFVPISPAPGTETLVILADNTILRLHYVLLQHSIRSVTHTILSVSHFVETPQYNEPSLPQSETDPLSDHAMAQAAPIPVEMSPEDAVSGL